VPAAPSQRHRIPGSDALSRCAPLVEPLVPGGEQLSVPRCPMGRAIGKLGPPVQALRPHHRDPGGSGL
jgi:hypothetical protein